MTDTTSTAPAVAPPAGAPVTPATATPATAPAPSATEPATEPAPTGPSIPSAAEHERKLSLLGKVKALTQPKEALQGQVETLTTERDALSGQVAQLTQSLATVTQQNADLTSAIEQHVAGQAQQVTEQSTARAHEIVASHGIAPSALPAATTELPAPSAEELWEQVAAATDPAEADRLRALALEA